MRSEHGASAGRTTRPQTGRPVATGVVGVRQLVELNSRLQEALARRDQTHSSWQHLVERAYGLMRVEEEVELIGNGPDSLQRPVLASEMARRWWLGWGQRWALQTAAVGTALLSCMVLCSEVSLALPWESILQKSLIGRLVGSRWIGPGMADLLTVGFLLYIAVCAYGSFLGWSVLGGRYRLLPHRHTDEKSLLFFAAMFCRFIFPLGYNYLALMEEGDGSTVVTEFSRVMGDIDLVPLFGRSFALYFFPVGLSVMCLVSLAIVLVGARTTHHFRTARISEGRILILRSVRQMSEYEDDR